MLIRLKSLWHPMLRNDQWHWAAQDGTFIWRRFRPETGEWETRPMTEAESRDAEWDWAIR